MAAAYMGINGGGNSRNVDSRIWFAGLLTKKDASENRVRSLLCVTVTRSLISMHVYVFPDSEVSLLVHA